MKKLLLSLIVLSSMISCGSNSNTTNKKSGNDNRYLGDAVGTPYELFVVADTSVYRGAIGDSLKVALREEVYMINFSEPSFDLFNVAHSNFNGINSKQRNVIVMYVNPKYEKAGLSVIRDKNAKPQLIIVLQAPNETAMKELVTRERYNIKALFEKEEIDRFTKRSNQAKDTEVSDLVSSMFGLKISIPKGYKLRTKKAPDFLWISLELDKTSQGLAIYDYPFTGDVLTDTMIVKMRNQFIANIPGALPKSYMTTAYEFPSETNTEMINDRKWYVTKGFWRVENDFMGGPYVSYSTIDAAKKRVIVIDCYVYSPDPSKKQRNLIHQLDGIARTAKIIN